MAKDSSIPFFASCHGDQGLTVNTADCDVFPTAAEMVAAAAVTTLVVSAVNVANVRPRLTVTYLGTRADFELLANFTTTPCGPAGPVRDTLPLQSAPPVTAAESNPTAARVGGKIVNVAECETPSVPPVNFTVTVESTPRVLTVKVADVAPAGNLTVSGTVAFRLLDETCRSSPPVGAPCESVAVAVTDPPPKTEPEDRLRPICDGPMHHTMPYPAHQGPKGPILAVPYTLPASSTVTPAAGKALS